MNDIIYAIASKNIAALQACFERGDDVNAHYKILNQLGLTENIPPIWYACQTRFESGALLLLDKSSESSLFFTNIDGLNPLLLSCSFSLKLTMKITEIDPMIGYHDNKGATPIMWAALFNQQDIIRHLLLLGHDIQAKDNLGQNALFYAIQSHYLDSTRFLLEQKIKVNERDCHGSSALMSVVCDKGIWITESEHGDRLIDCLLNFQADPLLFNNEGKNSIHYAILQNSNVPLATLLTSARVLIDDSYLKYADDHQCDESSAVLQSYREKRSLTQIMSDAHGDLDDYLKI